MKTSQLNQVLRLIRRTGDRAVIMDPASEEVLVLMNLSNYEELLDQSEESLEYFDNPNISVDEAFPWSTSQEETNTDWQEDAEPADIPLDYPKSNRAANSRFTSPYQTPAVDTRLDFSTGWTENHQNTGSAMEEEVSLEDVPSEEEEEKFYLEPIDEA